MPRIPAALDGLPELWHGVDDDTPKGCSLFVTELLGLATTYVLRTGSGRILGRVESQRSMLYGYAGPGLKGGRLVGQGSYADLLGKIAQAASVDSVDP